jgi:cytochrome c-type biogenesis protein CcmE
VKKQRKFLVGGAIVAGLVGYLMVTGMQESMVYYHTPTELLARSTADPSYADVGVKVGREATWSWRGSTVPTAASRRPPC